MRRSANLALAAALLAVALVAALLAARLPGATAPAEARAAEPYSSRWLCPVLPGGGSIRISNAGSKQAVVRATLSTSDPAQDDAAPVVKPTQAVGPLAPGASGVLPVNAAFPGLLQIESFGAPVVTTVAGQPPCATSAVARSWLSVGDIPNGGDTEIVLGNPGKEGAVVQLVLHTAGEAYRPQGLHRLFVPGRGAKRVSLKGSFAASLPVSVEVISLLGRTVVGAVTTSPRGAPMIVPAQSGTRATWTFAGGLGAKGTRTDLAVTNPNGAPLVVDVRVITGKDAFTPPGFEDLQVGAGATSRRQLDTQVAGKGTLGVEIRSRDAAPFTAALLVRPAKGAAFIDPGGSVADRWVLPPSGQPTSVAIANFAKAPAGVRITGLLPDAAVPVPLAIPGNRITLRALPPSKTGLVVQLRQGAVMLDAGGGGRAVAWETLTGPRLAGPVVAGPAAG